MILIPVNAKAENTYVAADIQFNFHKYEKNRAKVIPHLNLVAGKNLVRNLWLELGAYYSNKISHGDLHLRKAAIHGCFVVLMPLNEYLGLRLGVGASQFMPSIKCGQSNMVQLSVLVPRISSGLDFFLTDCVTARAHMAWEASSALSHKHKIFKDDNLHLSLGLGYKF